jgi:NADH-quinone oxidoreductase subunit J
VAQRNPVYSLVSLVGSFFGLCGLYVLLEAPFVAVVQIIVYAGAIMVLFLFVVMVLNVPREDAAEWDRAHPLYRPMAVRVGGVLALLLALELGWALARTSGLAAGVGDQHPAASSVAGLGQALFTNYMFAFEVTSILIIAAMVGAVVLSRKRED